MSTIKSPPFKHTLKFLILCCQTDPSEKERADMTAYLHSQEADLQSFIGSGHQHGILPLIYKSLKKLSETDPYIKSQYITLLTELKSAYIHISQKNMYMSAELINSIKVLNENDIKALAFKGPTLSQMAYGDITLRQFGDLDLLIEKKDRKKVEELFLEKGYIPYLTLTDMQKKIWYTFSKDIVLFHPQKKIYLEIHWLLLDDDYPLQMDLANIWTQTQTVHLNTHPVQTFTHESLLLYLCIHGSKHLWERIVWIKDIDQIIRTQNINLEKVVQKLEDNSFQRMFYLGLSLSQDLFDTPLPQNIQKAIKQEYVLPGLSNFVLTSWEKPQNMFLTTLAMLQLFPKLKMKLHYMYNVLIKPSYSEYSFIDLPDGFHWLYYLVRPYLLIKKYLGKT